MFLYFYYTGKWLCLCSRYLQWLRLKWKWTLMFLLLRQWVMQWVANWIAICQPNLMDLFVVFLFKYNIGNLIHHLTLQENIAEQIQQIMEIENLEEASVSYAQVVSWTLKSIFFIYVIIDLSFVLQSDGAYKQRQMTKLRGSSILSLHPPNVCSHIVVIDQYSLSHTHTHILPWQAFCIKLYFILKCLIILLTYRLHVCQFRFSCFYL